MKMSERQRTHPFGIVDSFIKNIRMIINALLPTIIILLGTDMGRRWLLPASGAILLLYSIYSIAWWYRYVYYIEDDELRLEYGLLARKKRYIPLERIQNVQLSENVLQRLLGLTGVKVETAGGSAKAEADLYSLRREQARQLRQLLQAGHSTGDTHPEQQPDYPEYRLLGRDLLLAAASSSRVLLIFSGLFALVSQIEQLFPNRDIGGVMEKYMYNMLDLGWLIVILLGLAALLAAWLLAFISEVMQWANFRLVVEGDRILISRGLLTRRQIALPRRRIQAVQIMENIIQQPLGLCRLKVIMAGSSTGNAEASVLYPLLRRSELTEFLQVTVPELAISAMTVKPIPRRAATRYFVVLLLPISLMLAVWCLLVPHGYYALVLLPLFIWLAYRQYKDAGWQLEGNRLLLRRRRVTLITTLLARRRLQSLDCSQSILQKRTNLSAIKAAVAFGNSGTQIKLVGIGIENSHGLQKWYREQG
ncbi:MAG: PH domain-containing protein [Syntrophomonadaceae bacterium]|nr:PH domain-containing protein [Syntrophomonadaceae bacterium]